VKLSTMKIVDERSKNVSLRSDSF